MYFKEYFKPLTLLPFALQKDALKYVPINIHFLLSTILSSLDILFSYEF